MINEKKAFANLIVQRSLKVKQPVGHGL